MSEAGVFPRNRHAPRKSMAATCSYFGELLLGTEMHIATWLVAVPWRNSFIGAFSGEFQNLRSDASSGKRTSAVRAPTDGTDLARNNRSLSWFAETSALPPLCSFQVSLQGISGVAQVLPAHQAHEGDEHLEHPLWRHLQFMIDARPGALRCKEETMAAA